MKDDGGAEGIRTPGLVNASHALCQLSYSPISNCVEMVRNQLLLCQGIALSTHTDFLRKTLSSAATSSLSRHLRDRSVWLAQDFSIALVLSSNLFFVMLKSSGHSQNADNG